MIVDQMDASEIESAVFTGIKHGVAGVRGQVVEDFDAAAVNIQIRTVEFVIGGGFIRFPAQVRRDSVNGLFQIRNVVGIALNAQGQAVGGLLQLGNTPALARDCGRNTVYGLDQFRKVSRSVFQPFVEGGSKIFGVNMVDGVFHLAR